MIAKLWELSAPEIVGNIGLLLLQTSIGMTVIGMVLLITGVLFYKGGY